MRAFGDAIADDADGGDAKNSDADDNGDDDQDDLQSTAAAGGGRSRCRRRWRRTDAGSVGARSNGSRSDRSPTLVAELRARVQSCAARIAECHTSPRACAVRKIDGASIPQIGCQWRQSEGDYRAANGEPRTVV